MSQLLHGGTKLKLLLPGSQGVIFSISEAQMLLHTVCIIQACQRPLNSTVAKVAQLSLQSLHTSAACSSVHTLLRAQSSDEGSRQVRGPSPHLPLLTVRHFTLPDGPIRRNILRILPQQCYSCRAFGMTCGKCTQS